MATAPEYVEYVCAAVARAYPGAVRSKKMFGEYMVYVDDKPLVLVCDGTAFVKMLPCLDGLMDHAENGYPYSPAKYPGVKEHYILDLDDQVLTGRVLAALAAVVPVPKPRRPKR